jgi:hypothetical protein
MQRQTFGISNLPTEELATSCARTIRDRVSPVSLHNRAKRVPVSCDRPELRTRNRRPPPTASSRPR